MTQVFSHSRLSSFENCPKQFHFRYVLELPAESEGIEAFVGKRVHEVLERLYLFVRRGQLPPLEKVIARYHALWDEHFDGERIRIVREGMTPEAVRDFGARCLRSYYLRHYPFDADETLGVEERVFFPLDDAGVYRIQGIIDRVVRTRDGTIEIHDYKTGQYVPSQERLDAERQLALYQLGLMRRYGDAEFVLVWHYLSRNLIRTSSRTPEQLDSLRQETIALIDRIQAERDFEPNEIKLCAWCEYRPLCPLWNPDADTALEERLAARKRGPSTPRSPEHVGQLNLL